MNNKSVRDEIAWLIVERMDDAVGFDEACEQVDDYLDIIKKRIDSIKNNEMLYDDHERFVIDHFVKELLK